MLGSTPSTLATIERIETLMQQARAERLGGNSAKAGDLFVVVYRLAATESLAIMMDPARLTKEMT